MEIERSEELSGNELLLIVKLLDAICFRLDRLTEALGAKPVQVAPQAPVEGKAAGWVKEEGDRS